jgi:hypothetical protein
LICALNDNQLTGKIPDEAQKVDVPRLKWLDENNPGWDESQTNCLY